MCDHYMKPLTDMSPPQEQDPNEESSQGRRRLRLNLNSRGVGERDGESDEDDHQAGEQLPAEEVQIIAENPTLRLEEKVFQHVAALSTSHLNAVVSATQRDHQRHVTLARDQHRLERDQHRVKMDNLRRDTAARLKAEKDKTQQKAAADLKAERT